MIDADKVRAIARSFPEVEDRSADGMLRFSVRGKQFAWSYLERTAPKREKLSQSGELDEVAEPRDRDRQPGLKPTSLPAGTPPGFPDGMVIGQHGSWNRSTLSGYKVVFVPFANGFPTGPPRDILSGFLAPDEGFSYGRPVGVTLGPDGSLLVAEDVGDVIWRVIGAEQGRGNTTAHP